MMGVVGVEVEGRGKQCLTYNTSSYFRRLFYLIYHHIWHIYNQLNLLLKKSQGGWGRGGGWGEKWTGGKKRTGWKKPTGPFLPPGKDLDGGRNWPLHRVTDCLYKSCVGCTFFLWICTVHWSKSPCRHHVVVLVTLLACEWIIYFQEKGSHSGEKQIKYRMEWTFQLVTRKALYWGHLNTR